MSHGQILALFRVDGRARTKGSLHHYCMKNRAHTVRVQEEVKESSYWRRVVALATQAHTRECWNRACLAETGPVEVRVVVYFARRLSAARGARDGTVWPSHQTPFPTDRSIGDVDKLARNVGDALQDAKIYVDDAQITDWLICKRWAPDGATEGWADILVMRASDPSAPEWMPSVQSVPAQRAGVGHA